MRSATTSGLAGLALAIFATGPALAGQLSDSCARQAANPFEQGLAEIGVPQPEMNVEAALAACASALEAEPGPQVEAWMARALYVARRYEEALPLADAAARTGNLLGMYLAGDIRFYGLAGPLDVPGGLDLLVRSADAGYAPSQYGLALIYQGGVGRTPDLAKAIAYYQLAAAQGHPLAEYSIGVLYRDGIGLRQNPETAVKWFEVAAARNEPNAMNSLGDAYEFGEGVPQDEALAFRWYAAAAALGNTDAQRNVGRGYELGSGIAQDYAKAMQYYQLAYANGARGAASHIGGLYLDGHGVKADIATAMDWITKGLAVEDYHAKYLMGRINEEGVGVPVNLEAARYWYTGAAKAGDRVDAPQALQRLR